VPRNRKPLPQLSFWAKFMALNSAMWYGNNALLPDPTKVGDLVHSGSCVPQALTHHTPWPSLNLPQIDLLTSHPYEWPLLLRGLRMNAWGIDDVRMYLLGNPAVWLGGAASLALWLILLVGADVRRQRLVTPAPLPPDQHAHLLLSHGSVRRAGRHDGGAC